MSMGVVRADVASEAVARQHDRTPRLRPPHRLLHDRQGRVGGIGAPSAGAVTRQVDRHQIGLRDELGITHPLARVEARAVHEHEERTRCHQATLGAVLATLSRHSPSRHTRRRLPRQQAREPGVQARQLRMP